MNKEIKKGLKKLMLIDSVAGTLKILSDVFDEADKELEELIGNKETDFQRKIKKIMEAKD